MTLLEWGALGELIGGIAIIVSLIYVGAQIKQNTKATTIATSQDFIHMHSELTSHISDRQEFRDIYWRGLQGLSNLQDSETAAFIAWMIQTFRAWEAFWFQWQEGVFDDRLWRGWRAQFCDLFGHVGAREAWSLRRHQLSDEFQEYVDQQVLVAASKPLYKTAEAET
jgi:hypothetical protein